ncbi:hypothetical protein XBP1_2080047 [Xenorhabdus bovienii str. puntauvense]|uniref:Uncharacterized protein n=1 Tax=Xenorhabdus bovienii str. puntauvense TaxID=1398201 RepID=A0A077NBW5_XENBV|nr:hypothetical protein XBP1_2080047 [Xenorhabdus bovienii str. puntauvense]
MDVSEIRTVLEAPTPYKKQPSLFVTVMVENHTVLAPPTKIKKYTVTHDQWRLNKSSS